MKIFGRVIAIGMLAFASLSANAAIVVFTSTLNGANETVPVATPGTGFATAVLDDVLNTLSINVSWSNLLSPTLAGHVHCCAAQGANAGVRINFAAPAFPVGVTSGSYSAVHVLGPTLLGGQTLADFLNGLRAGLAYINIHTGQFPAGEIRGQLQVPEPATLAMFGLGLAGLGLLMRRKKAYV